MYRFALPAPPLMPYIESYWFIRAEAGQSLSLSESIFVDGRADILFNFGVGYQRRNLTGETEQYTGFSNVDAPREYPVAIIQQGSVDIVGVRFRAGGLSAFLTIPLHHLSNYAVPVRDILSSGGMDLEGRLFDARQDTNRQVALLDAFFQSRLHTSVALVFSHRIAAQIDAAAGMISIRQMCADTGYSIRTVDRMFRQFYGVTPKFYARIARFQHVMRRLMHEPNRPLIDIAADCGYYDGSHFTHEFQQLMGKSPESYRAYLATRTAAPPPNLVQILQAEQPLPVL